MKWILFGGLVTTGIISIMLFANTYCLINRSANVGIVQGFKARSSRNPNKYICFGSFFSLVGAFIMIYTGNIAYMTANRIEDQIELFC
mmetsp:Transcript_32154/g.49170  ORF Transcript_32154/g.49170 Transcript_32154/m.49170 type:complete len:88 (-) Transcript_32154:467-730(-)